VEGVRKTSLKCWVT